MSFGTDDAHSISGSTRPIAEYAVYWRKPVDDKRTLLLQFPSRSADQPYNLVNYTKPLELRIKPRAGLVEIEVPIGRGRRYDISKGSKYAAALKESRSRQTTGSAPGRGEYGLAGGFGINAHLQGRSVRATAARDIEVETDELNVTDEEDLAMSSLTLGGRIQKFKREDPIYAIATFRNDELHLSKIDAICSMQPQFHHLDAITDNERVSSRLSTGADHSTAEPEARAVNLTVKPTEQEHLDVNEVDRTLRDMQEEPWERLSWGDESDTRSMVALEHGLRILDSSRADTLVSSMTEAQYLDAISAPRIDPTNQGKRVMISRQWEECAEEAMAEDEDKAGASTAAAIKSKHEPD